LIHFYKRLDHQISDHHKLTWIVDVEVVEQ